MRFLSLLGTAVLICFFYGCSNRRDNIQLNDLKFNSIFGSVNKKSKRVYCLLGRGFFRTTSSKNSDSLISAWIQNHANADVIPVSTLNNMTYCWLVDGQDTINTYLIKNGCFPGGVMTRPETYGEMSDEMKSSFGKFKLKVHIDDNSYKKFLERIESAENYAKIHKLGIWDDKFSRY